jgi:type IV pilus assembly protein PilE
MRKFKINKQGQLGITLIELMVVIAIVAILTMVAMPSYEGYILKTNRSIGKAELQSLMARQEQFFTNNKRYATNLTSLGYSASPFAINRDAEEVGVGAGDRIYQIQLTGASATAYTVQAIPQLKQANDTSCGTLQITSLGVRSASGGGRSAGSPNVTIWGF